MLLPRHILITGASSGIGAALAVLYAMPGVRLSLHGRNEERLVRVAEAAQERGAFVHAKTGDVVWREGMEGWITICDRKMPLDLVIANAGISAGTGRSGESDEQARAIFEVNVAGVLNTVQPAMAIMKARGRGQIAIMSSLAGFRGFPGAPAYGASKATVRIYGEALRFELAPHGIAVNVICPGFIKTPMTEVNRFKMPFLMDVERAAQIIKRGLERNQARIAFPWQMYALVRLASALPQDWIAGAVARLPKKAEKS